MAGDNAACILKFLQDNELVDHSEFFAMDRSAIHTYEPVRLTTKASRSRADQNNLLQLTLPKWALLFPGGNFNNEIVKELYGSAPVSEKKIEEIDCRMRYNLDNWFYTSKEYLTVSLCLDNVLFVTFTYCLGSAKSATLLMRTTCQRTYSMCLGW